MVSKKIIFSVLMRCLFLKTLLFFPVTLCAHENRLRISDEIPIQGPYLLHRNGYSVCYDGRTKTPIWVYEKICRSDIGKAARTKYFSPDRDLPTCAQSSLLDFKRSGYDRGHMAASANHSKTKECNKETFLLSNICPQVGLGCNRDIWKKIEDLARRFLEDSEYVEIVSGPLFLPKNKTVSYHVIGKNAVSVPTHFFKIIAPKGKKSLAFLVPNEKNESGVPLEKFQTTLQKVERLSGLFFDLEK